MTFVEDTYTIENGQFIVIADISEICRKLHYLKGWGCRSEND